AKLTAEFKEYAEFASPKPLGLGTVQALLAPTEPLLLFLDPPRFVNLPEETLAWVVTKETVRWRLIALGTGALADRVASLRCGLDASNWVDATGWPQKTAIDKQRVAEQQARRARCEHLLGFDVSPDEWPPFDLAKSYELY